MAEPRNARSAETEKDEGREGLEAGRRPCGTDGGRGFWRHDSAPIHKGSLDPESPLGVASEAPSALRGRTPCTPLPGRACETCCRSKEAARRSRGSGRVSWPGEIKPSVRSKGRQVTHDSTPRHEPQREEPWCSSRHCSQGPGAEQRTRPRRVECMSSTWRPLAVGRDAATALR